MATEEQLVGSAMRAGVWHVGAEYTWASGDKANNKLEMDRVLDDPVAAKKYIKAMRPLADPYVPDALWGVPKGGQLFAERISDEMGLPLVRLEKLGEGPETQFDYASKYDQVLAEEAMVLVGFEDLVSKLTNVRKAMQLNALSEKTVAIVAAWIRSMSLGLLTRPEDKFELKGAVIKPVPPIIDRQHPFYKRYGHLAVDLSKQPNL